MAESEDARPAIGIDLGTTNCRVGIWLDEENRFELISNDHGLLTTPSYVAFTETERLIGDAAREQVFRNPVNTVFDVKRLIGRKFSDLGTDADKMHVQWPFKVALGKDDRPLIHVEYKGKEKAFSAVDIHSMLLGKLKDLAEVHSGSVVNTACVSVPHCFTSAQRQATRSACSLAGFDSVTLVSEPVCAALTYTLTTIGPSRGERSVVVFDLGGGALDVTVLTVDEGVVQVKATSGDAQLGGEDFDLRLLHHFIREIREKYERDVTSHPRVVRRLKKQVELVKLTLSSETEASLQIESLLEDFTFYSTVTRACFEEMNADLFERIMARVRECLERAGLESKDVDEVVLTGGSSRIPKVVELLAVFFDASKLNTEIDPGKAVVCGAAARAGIARGCGAFADYRVVDVLPMSLGVETADGGVHVMHRRGAAIPDSSEQVFTTVYDDQDAVVIRVFEGEHPQDGLVATVELSGIAPAPSGVPQILVRLDVDAYGILTVSVEDKTTGEKVEVYTDQEVEIDQDEERRRGSAVQVYHHASVSSENPTSNVSESNAREFIEAAPEDKPSISTSQGFSEPLEARESGNTAESELQEISGPPPSFELSESKAEDIPGPSPSFEASKAVENKAEEIFLSPPSFEAVETCRSQGIPPPSPASELIDKALETKTQEISEPSPPSPAFGLHEMSAPPPALETQEIPEPISPSSPALWSFKSMESRPQEFFDSSPAFDSSNSVEFFETSPVFESSNALESKSLDFRGPMEKNPEEPPQPHEPPPPQSHEPPPPQPHEPPSPRSHEPPPPQPHEPPSPQPHEPPPPQAYEPPPPQPHEPPSPQPHEPPPPQPYEPPPPQPHEPPPPQPHEPTKPHDPEASESTLVQEILDTVREIAPISDFRTHKRECATFIRRVNMLVPLFEEVRDLELHLSEELLACFKSLEAGLVTAKDLLLLCSKGSKFWLVLEERKVAEKFLVLNAALVQALDQLPDALGISDEVREQVDLVHNQLKRSKALEDAVDAQLNAELDSLLDEANERSPDQLRSLAESFKMNTASALQKELDALEGMTKEKSPGLVTPERFDQIFGLLSGLRNLFPVGDSEQHGSVESVSSAPSHSSSSVEGRSQEFSAHSTSNSIDAKSQEHCQVGRAEKTMAQDSSAPPSHSSNSVEGRSQEFSAHSSINSIDAKSQEHCQVGRDEKTMAQDSSAPPSHSSNSVEGRSQEFSAHSASNSIDGRSLEPSQVGRDEKIMAQESSAPPSHSSNSIESRSQEFSAQPQYSIDGRSSQVNTDERIKAQEPSEPPPPQLPSQSQEFPPWSPYNSSNSIDGRSPQVHPDERNKAQEPSAPPPLPSTSKSQEFPPRSPYSSSNGAQAPQGYAPSKSFGSRGFSEQQSSTSTPESSQNFPEYSSKPDFPDHSPRPAAASTHKLVASPSHRSSSVSISSSSEASSGEISGLMRGVQDAAAPDHVHELRRAATGVEEAQQHLPKPESTRSASSPQLRSDSVIEDVVKKYAWNQVLDVTNDLSKSIGKGGFGAVYLGKLENEKEVAVKILDANSQQGITEFLNEVNLLKRVNHVNLVRLLGYCLEEKQVLIYEFAEEGSIWDHLQAGGKFLDWKTRLKVALESACGLEYLHTGCHPRIIHRDIKSQNILLTRNMVAKVADFGLSKLGADQDNVSKTHVTTMVKGTLGYLDPEYLKTGQLTEKSDVYSFGVVLLEIITGRKPIQTTDRKGFIGDWVEDLYNSNNSSSRHLKHIVDPTLGSHYNSKAMKLVVNIAKDCIHLCGIDRPEMTEVVHILRKAQMIEHDEKKPSKWLPFL